MHLQPPARVILRARVTMLKLLKIKNIALVSGVELELGPGLTLLTGETGAGKSILIDALGLLLGDAGLDRPHPHRRGPAPWSRRVRRERRRRARPRARTACPPRTTRSSCAARSTPPARAGRPSTARSCPCASCASWRRCVAAIHGQHEPQGLLDPETHLDVARPPRRADRRRGRGRARPTARLREVEARSRRCGATGARPSAGARCSSSRPPRSSRRRSSPGEEEALRQEKARAGQRRPPGRAAARGLRAALRGRGRRPRPARPGLPQGRGAGAHRPAVRALPRGARRRARPSSRTWRSSCATTARRCRSARAGSTRSRRGWR